MARIPLLLAALALACDRKPDTGDSPAGSAAPAPSAAATASAARPVDADAVYRQRCAVCHGKQGHGDGPGAAALEPQPRSFADSEWQKSVSDEQIEKAIVQGGAAVGKSGAMPANPDLKRKPEIAKALVEKVRSFGR